MVELVGHLDAFLGEVFFVQGILSFASFGLKVVMVFLLLGSFDSNVIFMVPVEVVRFLFVFEFVVSTTSDNVSKDLVVKDWKKVSSSSLQFRVRTRFVYQLRVLTRDVTVS